MNKVQRDGLIWLIAKLLVDEKMNPQDRLDKLADELVLCKGVNGKWTDKDKEVFVRLYKGAYRYYYGSEAPEPT